MPDSTDLLAAGIEPAGSSPPPGWIPPTPEMLCGVFPQLEILALIGQGGMGAVYKARQIHLERLVAVKLLSAERGVDPAFVERFTREARALARLQHSQIVTLYDFGRAGSWLYLVMEYVEGANLRQVMATAEAFDGSLATDVLTVTVTSPPTVAISLPTNADTWLSIGSGLTISGTTSGSAMVSGVTYGLAGATSSSGSATGTASWTFSPALNPGITIVTMTAMDTNGHTGQGAITITHDVSDPIVAISSPASGGTHLSGTAHVTISGAASDDAGIVGVSYQLSGATVATGTATGTTSWSLVTPALSHGVTTVTITARDVADQTSVVALDLLYPTTSEVGTGGSSQSCGLGSGLAAILVFACAMLLHSFASGDVSTRRGR